jgi:hypothetical protein
MEFTITLTDKELEILNDAVIQLPFFKVAGLINKLREQVNEQIEENKLKEIIDNDKIQRNS